MTQAERDRLVVPKKAQKKLITQKQAAVELEVTERHVRRLLAKLGEQGDKAVIHGLRGRTSNRRLSEEDRAKAAAVLSQEVYRGFGPRLASEDLANKPKLRIGRRALRRIMMGVGLWRGRQREWEQVPQWLRRRSCRGEQAPGDTLRSHVRRFALGIRSGAPPRGRIHPNMPSR